MSYVLFSRNGVHGMTVNERKYFLKKLDVVLLRIGPGVDAMSAYATNYPLRKTLYIQ
jgi:hypothetical protein